MSTHYKNIGTSIVDRLGIVTSGLCAIHCALIPIFLSLGLIGSINGSTHGYLEIVIIVISSFLGIISILNGLKGHGKIIPQLLIGSGALVIITGLLSNFLGHIVMAIGGVILVYGHWLNWKHMTEQSQSLAVD